jgi:hypothetical protein
MVYVSAAVKLFGEQELSELLAVSRRNKSERNLTGMLCYSDGNFIQAWRAKKARSQHWRRSCLPIRVTGA